MGRLTQQSYWQLFNSAVSRPFRTTDHEPELVYIYPHQIDLAGGWKYRLSGLGLNHQSNGQSLPLSRSWNRVYLMGAAERELDGTRYSGQSRNRHRHLAHSQTLLGHKNRKMTEHYVKARIGERVKPLL